MGVEEVLQGFWSIATDLLVGVKSNFVKDSVGKGEPVKLMHE